MPNTREVVCASKKQTRLSQHDDDDADESLCEELLLQWMM